jgi:hypothetical protein
MLRRDSTLCPVSSDVRATVILKTACERDDATFWAVEPVERVLKKILG